MIHHFAIGVALLAIIPALCIVYMGNTGWFASSEFSAYWPVVISLTVLATGATGFALLRTQPRFIFALRTRLERVVSRELPDKAPAPRMRAAGDMEVIEKCLTVIIEELVARLRTMEADKAKVEAHLLQAQKMESMRTMSIGMAHEYNNMLAAILGNISMVIRSLPPEAAGHESALQVEATALQAVELTNKIMAYSGKGQLRPKEFNLSDVVTELTNLLSVSVPRGVTLEYHLVDNLPPLFGDPNHIRQVVINLVLNAAEAYPNRQGSVSISSSLRACDRAFLQSTFLDEDFPEGQYVCLEVTDRGCGMPPAVQARMFDPFFTTKIRAHGLGLAVVMGVVRAHGGTIRVQSAPNQGTTMQLLFPLGATRRPPGS